jgi:hypothetical protein
MSLPRESARDFSGLRVGPDPYLHRGSDDLTGPGGIAGLMDRELFAGFTVFHTILGVVALLAAITVLRALFGPRARATASHMVQSRCPACG